MSTGTDSSANEEIDRILVAAGIDPAGAAEIQMMEVDSLLIAELIAIAERHLGHRLSIGVFPHTATLGELLDRLS